jgi:tetratricopeptide (TPR) repeat protein
MRRCEARRRAIGAALLLFVAAVPAASASTRSQYLYAKALVPFHAHRWEEANQLLDEAATADPNDAVVAYYRGLANSRLGFPDRAIKEMERALALRPDLQPAVLDLGILYFQSGQYDQAQEWLQRAYKQPSNRFSAAFFLGLTELRLGDAKGAQPYFAEAAKDPTLRQSAQYYQAVAAQRAGDGKTARTLLTQVAQGTADAETTQIAKQYLAAPAAAVTVAEEKRWSVYGRGGFGYDSNVTLTPNNATLSDGQSLVNCYTIVNGACKPLDTDGEMDGFFAASVGGQYRMFAVEMGQGTIGYDFYQSVHFTTPSFDLQNHEIHLDLASTQYGLFQFGVSGFYDFYLLDYASFYQQGRGVPWVTLFEGEIAATQAYYQIIGQDYLGSLTSGPGTVPPTEPGYSIRNPFNPFRDAINNAVGIRQYFLLGAADRFMSIGYQWDNNDPTSSDGTDFAYTDNMFDVRVDFGILDWARGTVGYLFDLQDYEHKNSRTGFSKRRHDTEHQIVISFVKDFLPWLSADLSYFAVVNNSNIPDFEYDRNIVQVAVRLHL